MSGGYQASEDNRRLENLIRVGTVTAWSKDGRVRVKMGDVLTGWIQALAPRAGPDRGWWIPEDGEQVLVLSPSGDLSQGVALAGLWSSRFPPVAEDADIARILFKNGDLIEHDRKSGDMTIHCKGTITIKAEKDLILIGKTIREN